MTLMDNSSIHPRLRIRLFLLLLSFTHCKLCSRSRPITMASAVDTMAGKTATADPAVAAPNNVTILDWTTTTIEVGWSHDGINTEYYEITATCVSSEMCRDGSESVSHQATSGTVRNLTSGAEYEIIVTAFNDLGQGNPSVPEKQRTNPNTVVSLSVTSPARSTFSIKGIWTTPEGLISSYKIECISSTGGNPHNVEDLDSDITEYTCTELSAGHLYTMFVYTVSGTEDDDEQLESEPASGDKRVYPETSHILTTATTHDSFAITWTKSDGYLTGYTFIYEPMDNKENAESGNEEISDPDHSITSHTICRLKAGTKYSVDLLTRSGEDGDIDPLYSDPDTETDRTIPATATNIRCERVETYFLDIAWDIDVTSLYEEFTVNYTGQLDTMQRVQSTNNTSTTLHDLRAGDTYTIEIYTHSRDKTSDSSVPINATTEPEGLGEVIVIGKSDEEIRIQWAEPNCDLGEDCNYDAYKVTHEPEHGDVEQQSDLALNARLVGLNPGELYNIAVQAVSGNTESKPQTITDRTSPPPSDKQPSSVPGVITTTQTTITVQFTYDFFTHDHGPVLYYSVIVTEDDIRGRYDNYEPERGTDPDPQMTTWAQAQGTTMRYQIDERYYYPWPYEDGGRSPYTIFITIGENTACDISNDRENYCNGPLKEGTPYRYQFRGYTAGGYTDTELSEPVYTDPDLTWLGIILCILGGLLLAILVILGIIYLLRKYPDAFKRKSDPSLTGNENPMPVMDGQEGNKKKKRKRTKPVKLSKYKDYFKTMSADMEFRFSEEYEELRSIGRDQTCDVSELAKNKDKNRYANILPYDSTRVQLSILAGDENSDYINANWIPGYNSPKEFIAAQGPLPGTKDDFWRMIWEYDVRTIVMVTQCTERGKVKCDHYWPFDNEPVYYGAIQVNMLSEEVFPEWTVREINLENGGICKKVRHFNFTAWPDHGVPKATQALLYFVRAVREQMQDDSSPTVVHCSAGGGRTGTFIALDRLIQHMRDNDSVDIYGIVCEMRMHRMFMIQSESQYVFIHQCVADLLREERGDSEWFNVHTYGNVPPMRKAKPDAVANHGI